MWYATLFALRACRQVDLYGMDFRSGKYHYFEEYDPGDDVRAVHSMEFLMMLGMHASRLVHHVQVAEPKALGDEGEVSWCCCCCCCCAHAISPRGQACEYGSTCVRVQVLLSTIPRRRSQIGTTPRRQLSPDERLSTAPGERIVAVPGVGS